MPPMHASVRVLRIGLFLLVMLITAGAESGPLAGNKNTESVTSDEQNAETASDQSAAEETADGSLSVIAADDLVSTYVDSLRQQVLPTSENSQILIDGNALNLDGLAGWSLQEISEQMSQLASGENALNALQDTGSVVTSNPADILSMEDLYDFNAGYYFVLASQDSSSVQQRTNEQSIAYTIGISTLGMLSFSFVVPTEVELGETLGAQNKLFDGAYFQTVSQARQPMSNLQRLTVGGRQGFGSGSGPSNQAGQSSGEAIPMIEFIQRVIDGILRNWLNILLFVLGVSTVGFVVSRLGNA